MSAVWSLTVREFPGPGLEPSCLGTATIDDETGAEIGHDTVGASVVAITLVSE